MCLAIPSKIIDIKEGWATVQSDKHNYKVSLSLVKDVKVGDYVLVHGDIVLNKMGKEEAKKILKMVNNNHCEK